MPRAGSQPRLKPWRWGGAAIPLDRPFRACEVGLSGGHLHRLSEDGFIEAVGRERAEDNRTHRTIWRATGRLRQAYDKQPKQSRSEQMAARGQQLANLVKQNPGKSTRFFAKLMGEKNTVTSYRIKLLEADGLVQVVKPDNWHRGIPFQIYSKEQICQR